MNSAVQRWKTWSFSCEVPVTMPIKLTFVAKALQAESMPSGVRAIGKRGAYIMNGMIAIEIHPERVASGALWPIAVVGQ